VSDATRITVHCAGKIFIRQANSGHERFLSEDDDPVLITLTADECRSWMQTDLFDLHYKRPPTHRREKWVHIA
jgi:hypothetical protein